MKYRVSKSDAHMIDDSQGNEIYQRKKIWRGSSEKLDNMNPNDIEFNEESLRDDPSQILKLDSQDMDKLNETIIGLQPLIQLKNIQLEFLARYLIPLYKKQRSRSYHLMLKKFASEEV